MVTATKPDLALVTGLYRTTNSVVRELDARLGRAHEITFIQVVTLLAVDAFDRPQPHLVADYLAQQSQTVTGVLDRLERGGYLRRFRDLDDRRAVRLELTDKGRELIAQARPALEQHLSNVLANLDGPVRGRLLDDLEILGRSVSTAPR